MFAVAQYREAFAPALEAVANRAGSDQSAFDRVGKVRHRRLVFDYAGGQQDRARRQDRGADLRRERGLVVVMLQAIDRAGFKRGAVQPRLGAQSLEQDRPGQSIRKAGQVVAFRDPLGPAPAFVDDMDAASEASQIDRSRQAGRPAADYEAIQIVGHGDKAHFTQEPQAFGGLRPDRASDAYQGSIDFRPDLPKGHPQPLECPPVRRSESVGTGPV